MKYEITRRYIQKNYTPQKLKPKMVRGMYHDNFVVLFNFGNILNLKLFPY